MDITTLILFGVPLPILIIAIVQALKWVKIVKTSDQARLATVITAAALAGAVVGSSYLPAETLQTVTYVATTVYSIIAAAFAYNKTLGKTSDPS